MAETGTQLRVQDDEESQDTEIILGTGRLLGIFFGLVILCTIFFTVGYMLGRGNSNTSKTEVVSNGRLVSGTNGKPSAVDKTAGGPVQPCTPGSANCPAASSQAATNTAPAVDNTAPAPGSNNANSGSSSAGSSSTAPSLDKSGTGGIYMVQVAAVSKREDADILVSALQKKQYPVFVATVPGDPLFHVQVGPFNDPKDAEAMRSRLSADGYNAIVKK